MALQNKTVNLNNHLFEALERLNDEDLSDEEIAKEVKRTDAMVGIAKTIIENEKVQVEVAKLCVEYGQKSVEIIPENLQIGYEKK